MERSKKGKSIYMDVCCLNRPFDDQTKDRIRIESEAVLIILNRCLDDWVLVGSEIIDYEISKIPDCERKKKVSILASISKKKISINEEIIKRAMELEKIGLRAIDALHVACAERFTDIMVTTDDEIVKKVKNKVKIEIENPVKLLTEAFGNE